MKLWFSEFYRFFTYFSGFQKSRKSKKGGLYAWDRHEANVTMREHVAELREPMWTHLDAYVA